MKNFKNYFYIIIAFAIACGEETINPNDSNQQEEITTLNLYFQDTVSKQNLLFTANDPDGVGGQPLRIDTIKISKSSVYSLRLEVLDKTKSPIEDITEEVEEEGNVHQFVFELDPSGLLSVEYLDKDENDLPIGIDSRLSTTAEGTGILNIKLRHFSSAENKRNQISTDTDLEIDFPIVIQ